MRATFRVENSLYGRLDGRARRLRKIRAIIHPIWWRQRRWHTETTGCVGDSHYVVHQLVAAGARARTPIKRDQWCRQLRRRASISGDSDCTRRTPAHSITDPKHGFRTRKSTRERYFYVEYDHVLLRGRFANFSRFFDTWPLVLFNLKLYYALARPLHQFYNMGALQLLSSAYIPYGEQALVN